MRKVKIMRAIPGSGKTHVTKDMIKKAEHNGYTTAHCSADDFHIGKDGVYRFDARLAPNAHTACMSKFLDSIKNGINNIFVDNTNTQVWEYTPYLQVAIAEGYEVEIIEVRCTYKTALKRQTHNVPEEHHKRMADRFEKILPFHKKFLKVINND